MRIEYLEKLIEAHKRDVADAEAEKLAISADLNSELEFLNGSKKGEDGGLWEGVSPDTTSRAKHMTERLKEWGVFAIVAVADAFVVFLSLRLITDTEQEAYFLSAPAVGVQILFPHLVGRAVADARSKTENSGKDWVVAGSVASAWIGYVVAMTILRVNLMAKLYFVKESKVLDGDLRLAIVIFSALILVGLGSWVLIRALNANPHRSRFSRLKYVYFNKQRALRRAEAAQAKAEADLEAELKVLGEVSDQWDKRAESYLQVGEASKTVYRRALVNQIGAPEFTSEYLPDSKVKANKARKKPNES
jgi:hypothetical protein